MVDIIVKARCARTLKFTFVISDPESNVHETDNF